MSERSAVLVHHMQAEEALGHRAAGVRLDNKDWSTSVYYLFFQVHPTQAPVCSPS